MTLRMGSLYLVVLHGGAYGYTLFFHTVKTPFMAKVERLPFTHVMFCLRDTLIMENPSVLGCQMHWPVGQCAWSSNLSVRYDLEGVGPLIVEEFRSLGIRLSFRMFNLNACSTPK